MIVVSAKDLTKAYGTDVILDKVSFHINKGDRVGIIGINGAGKSTLLKMLTGEMSCESGDYFISADTKIGYLKQDGYVVMSVVSHRELVQLNRLIQEIDPHAFIVVNQVNEVRGRGFTMKKKYDSDMKRENE